MKQGRYRAIGITLLILAATTTAGLGAETEVPTMAQAPLPANVARVVMMSEEGPIAVGRDIDSLKAMASIASGDRERLWEGIVRAVLVGPTDDERKRGITSALPEGTSLGRLQFPSPGAVVIALDPPDGFVGSKDYSPAFVEYAGRQFTESLLDLGLNSFTFQVRDPATGVYKPIRSFLPREPQPGPEPDNAQFDGTPPVDPAAHHAPPVSLPGQIAGALSGKAVVLNQSHGWFDDNDGPLYRWRVQRGRCFEQIEDYASAEFFNHFLVPMLHNCGARVQPVRECDSQTNMVIVDNSDGSPAYVETGTWLNSSANGFVKKAQWTGTLDNPFGNASATRYASGVSGTATATASYIPNIPAAGFYNVYISFSKGTNRATNAHWQVHHTGGVTDFYVNQQRDGATWLLLGNFHFNAGQNATTGKAMLLNNGTTALVTCDAVRFGGGMGSVARRTHGLSGKARWKEDACNYLQFTGMLATTLMSDDPTATSDDEELGWSNRPQYANWEQSRDSEGANIVYIGWHTNAYNFSCSGSTEVSGTGRGTVSYRDVDDDATAGTENLTTACHNAVINGIRKFWDSSWNNRGIVASNSYGECSQGNLGSVAGFFFEGLFHDNSVDCGAYKNSKFRYIMARAITQGIISHYGGTTFPPEPPVSFRIRNAGSGQATLNWAPGPVRDATYPYGSAAASYRVYRSTNGYGFDNGTAVASTAYTTALTAGQVYYFRVAAVNSAGISFPTETLAVRLPSSGATPLLIVNGSDRFDRYLPKYISESNIGGCVNPNTVRVIDPPTYQSFNYVIQHAKAIANAAMAFDSCSNECVESGLVTLPGYSIVDWIGAQEAETDTGDGEDNTAIKPNSRTALQTFLQGGGRLFMSNAELAWDFGRSGAEAAKTTFLTNYMKCAYSADDANTYQAQGSAGIFSGIGTFNFDNGSGSTYEVRFPDVLTPSGGSSACMSYVGGTGGTAAVQYAGTFGSSSTQARLVYMGFGFETILSETVRNTVMTNILSFFNVSRVEDSTLY